MDRDRLTGADFLRAIGCILILLHHYAQTIDPATLSSFPRFVINQLVSSGPIAISIFFALSGFLLALPFWKDLDDGRDFPSLRNYFLRRGARIIPGYLLALSVTFVLSVILFGRTLDLELLERFVAGLLLINGWNWISFFPVEINGPLWSISFYATSYAFLLVAFAALFLHRSSFRHAWQSRAAWFLVILTSLLLHAIFLKTLRPPVTLNTWDDGFIGLARMWWPSYNPIGLFAIFAIGSLTAGLVTTQQGEHSRTDVAYRMAFLVVGTVVVVSYGGLITGEGISLGLPSAFPFGPLLVGTVLLLAPAFPKTSSRIENALVRYIARISFGIYVWHALFIGLAEYTAEKFGLGEGGKQFSWQLALVMLSIATIAVFAVASLSYRFFELPLMNRAKKIEATGKPAPGERASKNPTL